MRLVTKEAIATALVDIIVFTYVCYLALGRLPIIESIRGVAALSLVLGVASRRIGSHIWYRHQWVATLAGLASIALGFATLVAPRQSLLALFVASIIGLWVADHLGLTPRPQTSSTLRNHASVVET
jgi:hypothetical protein